MEFKTSTFRFVYTLYLGMFISLFVTNEFNQVSDIVKMSMLRTLLYKISYLNKISSVSQGSDIKMGKFYPFKRRCHCYR
jgi:hypothetical protein